jgi:cold shock CspA family protein
VASPSIRQQQQKHQQLFCRHFSLSSNYSGGHVSSDDDDAAQQPYLTGTVKFYTRTKLYGFIVPDDPLAAGGNNEVWFHRTGIQSPYSFEKSPARPYLNKHERVKFRLEQPLSATDPSNEENDDKKSATAIDIIFENGRQVPLYRKK